MNAESVQILLKGKLPKDVLVEIPHLFDRFKINTPFRLAHFLSQCHHESMGFTTKSENLMYTRERLIQVFPRYFNADNAKLYARNPEKIANRVYANRIGNGNEESGDGFKFRGRGFIQLTGKFNYEQFAKFINDDVVNNPSLVCLKYPLISAGFFFEKNGLWYICDRGATETVVKQVTKIVNGGTNGLKERIELFKKYYLLLK